VTAPWDRPTIVSGQTKATKSLFDAYSGGLDELFASRARRQSIMALGDSLSGLGVSPYAGALTDSHYHRESDWLFQANLLLDSPFDVLGSAATAGFTVEQIRDTHLPTVLDARPTYCVCWSLGANNALPAGEFPRSMLDVSAGILSALENDGITPILATLPPVQGGSLSWDETDRYNTFVSHVAHRRGYPFLDAHGLLVNPATGAYRDGLSDDGLHPNALGTAVIAAGLAELLRRLDETGSRAHLLDVNLLAGGSPGTAANSHLVAASGTTPTDWYISPGAGVALAAQPAGRPGNQLTLTRTGGVDVNALGTKVPCSPGDVWTLAARVGATRGGPAGRWRIGVADQNGTTYAARAEGQGLDVADTRVLHWRGVVPAGITQLAVYAGVSGADGTALRLAQVTLRNLSTKAIPL
jgi:lysophospholipase L1-like esterase